MKGKALKEVGLFVGGAILVYLVAAGYFLVSPPRSMFWFVAISLVLTGLAGFAAAAQKAWYGVPAALGVLLGIYLVVCAPAQFLFTTTVECRIIDFDVRKPWGSEGKDTMMVYTDYKAPEGSTKGEPFKNVDSIAHLKTDSGPLQGQLKDLKGQRARLQVSGCRFSWFSWNRNVISAEPLN